MRLIDDIDEMRNADAQVYDRYHEHQHFYSHLCHLLISSISFTNLSNLSIHPSIYLRIHLYIYLSIHSSVHSSIYLLFYTILYYPILSLPHSEPDEYNEAIRKRFLASIQFDANTYSEPIMYLRLLQAWKAVPSHRHGHYCHKMGLVLAVMKQFQSISSHLAHTVESRFQYSRRFDKKMTLRSYKHDAEYDDNDDRYNYDDAADDGGDHHHHDAGGGGKEGGRYQTTTRTLVGNANNNINVSSIDLNSMGPLTKDKINSLRLILLWCSSGRWIDR